MEKEAKGYFERCPEAKEVWSAGGKLWTNAGAAQGAGEPKHYKREVVMGKKEKENSKE